ncbi:DUF262 domain-containing protein [Pyxidicoccus trucidator]|uniref:DUF262 domain-containing protein n=1 Tax=Pyxidicoccus trucidator TaxID=2709662 RepID=UPI0013D93F0D|nr:DUF262 domain-containing protein [Pyxidicoccus trucidator]
MTRAHLPPPIPEVQHLPTVLRRVQSGEIRVPAFQRGYVWSEKQILELLESVYKGYPIGSLLFWNTESGTLITETDQNFPSPGADNKQPTSFILDGQQRLTTLFNCFYPRDIKDKEKFNVSFDLRKQAFYQTRTRDSMEGGINLGVLFAPREFLNAQRELAKLPDGEALLDQAITLHAVFQEYMIPTVTIKGRNTKEVVEIFERINNTGTRLSAVDFMRAVTWSERFDLTKETSRLKLSLEDDGFNIPPETFVKVLAVSFGKAPTLDEMLELRGKSAVKLRGAMKLTENALRKSIEFLKSDFRIYSYDYVPYEAQLIVVAKLFLLSPKKQTAASKTIIRNWLWATNLTEGLQGKPDSYIANLVDSVEHLEDSRSPLHEIRIDLEPEDLVYRRFIVRRALSSALATLFSMREAKSLVTGDAIDPQEFMSEFNQSSYYPIVEMNELSVSEIESDTARLLPNMILGVPSDRKEFRKTSVLETILTAPKRFGKSANSILDSQLITDECLRHLKEGDWNAFLYSRAQYIIEQSIELLTT